MRKIFQRNVLTEENKKQINLNLNNKTDQLKTETSNQNENGPIKLIDKNIINSMNEQNNINSLMGINDPSIYNNYNSINTNNNPEEEIFSSGEDKDEKQSQSILPMLSKTESNLFKKRAKTATDRFKIRLESISNMFKNEPKLYFDFQKKMTFKHRGLIPGIPNDLLTRLKLVFNIFKNPKFVKYVKKAPPKRVGLEAITDYLWAYNKDHSHLLEFYAIFFYYLCTNIKYDINEMNKNEKNLNVIFKNGFANSLQFCKLFEFMCKKNFLRIKRIEGFCKSKELPHYKKGSDVLKVNHYWNAIYINKEWYFCDLTFGSGGIKKRKESIKDYFSPYYFLTPADNLIETHRPIDDMWQMTKKIIPANQFSNSKELVNSGDFYKQVFDNPVTLVTHKYPLIKCENKPISIQIGIKECAIQAFLYNSKIKSKVSEVKFGFNSEDSTFTLEPVFPSNGEYWLEILFREFSSNEVQYLPLIKYKIIVDDSQEKYIENIKKQKLLYSQKEKLLKEIKTKRPKSVKIPNISKVLISREQINSTRKQTKICLDNEGAYLISPNSNNIKIGQINNFKVKVPNSESVCVLDGREWNYLKRNRKDKNTWFGNIEIKNENVLILSVKENKIFTEVFQLKAHYVSSNLLRLSQQRKDNFKSMRNLKKNKL